MYFWPFPTRHLAFLAPKHSNLVHFHENKFCFRCLGNRYQLYSAAKLFENSAKVNQGLISSYYVKGNQFYPVICAHQRNPRLSY